ncbi:MAG: xanthine dehydrogenase family protein molybdopterin-binding subunit [Acidobacteria bacterium]|nr:xanthine dehydrogenase family protein molybdopterin-binding subunit [Acidobacteriota bacterium]
MQPGDNFEPERFELREGPLYHFEVDRREFFCALGAGVLITCLSSDAVAQTTSPQTANPRTIDARIHVADDGTVTVFSGKVEEGQGARTELAMAAAEELGVPLERVRVQLADTSLTPDDGLTAGSRTTPGTIPAVRQAAAVARGYLDAERKAKTGAPVKAPADWRLLGTGKWRTDARDIVTGAHKYPSDVAREGMLYGCVLRPPAYGATLESVDLDAARKLAGVVAVKDGDFAGCAARTSYAARKAVEALAAGARWQTAPRSSSATLFSDLREKAREKVAPLAGSTHAATFHTAYVQHAPMEPRAAVAEWQDGKLTVWTGTSNPFSVRDALVQAFHITKDKVRVIVPDFGGGCGGKHTGEAAIEAARLAKEAGKPVKVHWTRAEEFMWAYFRPAALIDASAVLNRDGVLEAWQFTNYNSGGAALQTPYRIARKQEKYVACDAPLRQGSYRALASTANNFAREAFMDELAAAAGRDPLDFRMAHLDNERIRAVLTAATERFGWARRRKEKRAPNRGIGVACGMEKNSVVAACVEIEVDPRTLTPRLLEIVEAFECGAILNPANTRSQVEGCILMGLGAALREEIQFENGRLTNGRFSAYKVTRLHDVPPKMEILLLDRRNQPSAGAGETPILAVGPAMANAMFEVTGKRVRSMPLR